MSLAPMVNESDSLFCMAVAGPLTVKYTVPGLVLTNPTNPGTV